MIQVSSLWFELFDHEETLRRGGAAATVSTKEQSDFEVTSCHRLDERTGWINATGSICHFYFLLLILKPTQWSVSIPWVCGQIRHCVDWIETRVWFSKTMHSNYKPVKPVLFSPMFQSLTTCGNSFLCCRCTTWSSYVIKNLVDGWDCDCETVIDTCSFVSVVYMDSLAFSPALDNSLNNLCIFALNPT